MSRRAEGRAVAGGRGDEGAVLGGAGAMKEGRAVGPRGEVGTRAP